MDELILYDGAYSGVQVDAAIARALAGGAIDQEIASLRAAVGSPLVANTVSEMTNTNRIYVYTGSEAGYNSGHWYYWNGSAWTDGGAYNSAAADDAMSDSSTNAVQNKVIKAYVDGAVETVDEAIEAITQKLAKKADTDGEYPALTVGTARQLVGSSGASDSSPYVFRKTGGGVSVGNRAEVKSVVGGTVAWNQQTINGNFADGTTGWAGRLSTITVSNGVATIVPQSDGTERGLVGKTSASALIPGHKFLFCASVFSTLAGQIRLAIGGSGAFSATSTISANTWTRMCVIANNGLDHSASNGVYILYLATLTTADSMQFRDIMTIDLTLMFGSAIADYLYSLETATAGAGIAKLKEWGFDIDTYHATNAGELEGVKTSGKTAVGFNQWDEEWEVGGINNNTGQNNDAATSNIRSKNYIALVESESIYVHCGYGTGGNLYWYDAEKNFASYQSFNAETAYTPPTNARYLRFITSATYGTTYNHDICINISDPARNGEYEPYSAHTYALDPVELRGIPMLDGNNNLYYDGDSYAPDGAVTRKFGIVDLGTLDWASASSSANGYYYVAFPPMLPKTTNAICAGFTPVASFNAWQFGGDKVFYKDTNGNLYITDLSAESAAAFKAAMSGQYLVYELATPTTETAAPYQQMQIVSPDGTEAWTDAGVAAGDRDIAIPVEHETFYPADLTAAIERVMVQVPPPPSGNGNYRLTATVTSGGVTYTWEATT